MLIIAVTPCTFLYIRRFTHASIANPPSVFDPGWWLEAGWPAFPCCCCS